MTTDRRQIEIHNPLLSIGAKGNLLLDTVGRLAPQEQAGNIPHLMGVGLPTEVTITAAAGATNIANVTFQVSDSGGNAVAGVFNLDILLSDASTGAGLTGTTATGGIAAAASGGVVLGVYTASKALRVQTNTAGKFVLAITDTGKTGFYPVAQNDWSGISTVGAQLVTGNYG